MVADAFSRCVFDNHSTKAYPVQGGFAACRIRVGWSGCAGVSPSLARMEVIKIWELVWEMVARVHLFARRFIHASLMNVYGRGFGRISRRREYHCSSWRSEMRTRWPFPRTRYGIYMMDPPLTPSSSPIKKSNIILNVHSPSCVVWEGKAEKIAEGMADLSVGLLCGNLGLLCQCGNLGLLCGPVCL